MGGTIELDEKEKWASYYSAVLEAAGYKDAAKYLYKLAYPHFGPMHKDEEDGINLEWTVVVDSLRTKQKPYVYDIQTDMRPKKPQLLEDISLNRFMD